MILAIDWDTVETIEDIKKILSHNSQVSYVRGTIREAKEADMLKYLNIRHVIRGTDYDKKS